VCDQIIVGFTDT